MIRMAWLIAGVSWIVWLGDSMAGNPKAATDAAMCVAWWALAEALTAKKQHGDR